MSRELKAARERVEEAVSILERMGKTGFPAVDDLRLILAALDEQEWRPIETAPRDGTVVLVYFPIFGRALPCEYDGGRWQTGVWTSKPQVATHWRPLPAPPVEVKG